MKRMKKGIITLLILFTYLASFSTNTDSLFVSSKEYQTLNDKIDKLEKENTLKTTELDIENAEFSKVLDAVDNRISDWYTNLAIGGGLFIVLLGGLFAIQWVNTKGIARNEAEKELKTLKSKVVKAEREADALTEKHSSVMAMYELLENEINNLTSNLNQ